MCFQAHNLALALNKLIRNKGNPDQYVKLIENIQSKAKSKGVINSRLINKYINKYKFQKELVMVNAKALGTHPKINLELYRSTQNLLGSKAIQTEVYQSIELWPWQSNNNPPLSFFLADKIGDNIHSKQGVDKQLLNAKVTEEMKEFVDLPGVMVPKNEKTKKDIAAEAQAEQQKKKVEKAIENTMTSTKSERFIKTAFQNLKSNYHSYMGVMRILKGTQCNMNIIV